MHEMCLGLFFYLTICIVLILPPYSECQTIPKTIPNCFGINARSHRTEVLPFQAGTAYHLTSSAEGISLSHTNQETAVQGCAYAFSIPKDDDFKQITVFIQKAEVKWQHATNDSLQIVFVGNMGSSAPLSEIILSSGNSHIRNHYLNTKSWSREANVIFMFINYTHVGVSNNLAVFHIKLTITPTYTCILSESLSQGEHTYVRNVKDPVWRAISDMFHPGWVLCADTSVDDNILSAPCIDYRLTCDLKFNCPPDLAIFNTNHNITMRGLMRYPPDEQAKNLICYSPSINWILIMITIFTVLNVILLMAISYIGIIRQYSPMRFIRLQSQFFACCCCCVPRRYIAALTGNTYVGNPFRRNSINSSLTAELPNSPPIYDNVRTAHPIIEEHSMCSWCFCKKRETENAFAESGYQLPPGYSDSSENVGVLPENILRKLNSLQRSRQAKIRDRAKASIPHLKPAPQRTVRSAYSLREELRNALRQLSNRSRALLLAGLNLIRFYPNHQRINRVHPLSTDDSQTQPLPTYGDFIVGDFPRGLIVTDAELPENPLPTLPPNQAAYVPTQNDGSLN